MGMMTRRNVKARAAAMAAPAVIEKPVKPIEAKEESFADKVKAKGLTKTEINRTSTADLQELAKALGVDGAEEMSGNQIKKMLYSALED